MVCLRPKGNTALGGVNVEDDNFNFLRRGNDLARVDVLLCPGHFGNVHQTFDARQQFNECTVVGDVRHAAIELGTNWEFSSNRFPRIRFKLLHAQRDPLCFAVELDHLNFDGLTNSQNLGG